MLNVSIRRDLNHRISFPILCLLFLFFRHLSHTRAVSLSLTRAGVSNHLHITLSHSFEIKGIHSCVMRTEIKDANFKMRNRAESRISWRKSQPKSNSIWRLINQLHKYRFSSFFPSICRRFGLFIAAKSFDLTNLHANSALNLLRKCIFCYWISGSVMILLWILSYDYICWQQRPGIEHDCINFD